ncbi:MAG: hypothetical protein IT244_09940 [Bacteroidia bacterium]|nr:hypothetical protein [Bacteroidia bacterium]
MQSFTYTATFDTTLSPDYYLVKIGVSEYYKTVGEKRKRTTVFVPLDTVIHDFKAELRNIGFYQELTKSAITEKTSNPYYYSNKMLFQVHFEFKVSRKDSVEHLFNKINKENLQSLVVEPKFHSSTLDSARNDLTRRGFVSIQKYAQQIADSNKMKILSYSNSYFGFNQLNRINQFGNNYYDPQQKRVVIDLSNFDYALSITYTYNLTDE